MKHFARIALFAALTLGVAGCAGESVLKGGTSLTAPVQNPVGTNEAYAVEAAYATALRSALAYVRLRRCKAEEVESVSNLCSRPSVVRQIQAATRGAQTAMKAFRDFRRRNPTLNAFSALTEARTAVNVLAEVLSTNGVK